MKLLTFAVPCYNSEAYMEKCIESLLPGGKEVEILIVDDGSKDRTAEIADSYAARYPSMIRVIHQENGGHGAAVNTGIAHARGLFFKVVDSDDWVRAAEYRRVLNTLRELSRGEEVLDMLIANYVYEKEGAKRRKVIRYKSLLPEGRIFGWDDTGHFRKGHNILMHSVIYRTQLLRECGLKLPEHTFYVDNLFVFVPLPYVKTMYYLDVNFYRYYIGRADQSVNESVMISRIDQQLRVNRLMVDYMVENRSMLKAKKNEKLCHYMLNYLDIITTISSIMLIISGTEENLEKKEELWAYLKQKDSRLYHRLRNGMLGRAVHLPGKTGRKLTVVCYKLVRKVFKFN